VNHEQRHPKDASASRPAALDAEKFSPPALTMNGQAQFRGERMLREQGAAVNTYTLRVGLDIW